MQAITSVCFAVLVLIQGLSMAVLVENHEDIQQLQHKLAYAEQEIYNLNVDLAETIEQVVLNQKES